MAKHSNRRHKINYGLGKMPWQTKKGLFAGRWGRKILNFPTNAIGAASGGALGYIGGDLSGAYAGAKFGWNAAHKRRPFRKMKRTLYMKQFVPPDFYGKGAGKGKDGEKLVGSIGNFPSKKKDEHPVNTPSGTVFVRGAKKFIQPMRPKYKFGRKKFTKIK